MIGYQSVFYLMNFIFCLVSLLGAFLLFQVQPVISKFILPWFGGSPGVWTTCMLFFQIMLFGGYTYSHFLAQRRPRVQALIHIGLLLAAAALLPIVPDSSLKPSGAEEPVGRILWLLLRTVGLPYFILSATSPLVQVWFSHRFPQRSPWRLYSLSNVGSLSALLTYPVLVETRWDVVTQTHIWSWAFVVFAVLMGALAWTNQKRDNKATPEGDLHPQSKTHGEKPTWLRRLLWLLLPGFASLVLLATTNHVCQDVAVIPFLWVVPLSLYLVSFIICFDHPRWYVRGAWALPAVVLVFLASGLSKIPWPVGSLLHEHGFITDLSIYFGAMFLLCMVCHGELARRKPGTKYLTEYYLLMSAGGALGGLLVSLVAPQIFKTFLEWSIALLVGFALVIGVACVGLMPKWRGAKAVTWYAVWLSIGVTGLWMMQSWEFKRETPLERTRDFYGALTVAEERHKKIGDVIRYFICGGTLHGMQNTSPEHRRDALAYYGPETGIGIALTALKSKPGARVGIIGMGVGAVACYAERGQTYRFYEINPNVVRIAQKWFTFTQDLEDRGAKFELALGDARLSLEQEPPQAFDVLQLDAFSGDSVPVHLLTREAFALYLRHLKPDGIIVIHITNHFLNLAPVMERAAQEFGLHTVRIATTVPEKLNNGHYSADYILLTRDEKFIATHPPVVPAFAKKLDVPLWTDHRHNLFQILQKH